MEVDNGVSKNVLTGNVENGNLLKQNFLAVIKKPIDAEKGERPMVMQEQGLVRKDGFSMELHSSGDMKTLKNIYDNLI